MAGITLLGIYAGKVSHLGTDGQPSAIIKQRITAEQAIHHAGIASDTQADRRVHGGPEKALHHYAAENFARLQQQFPASAALLQAGSIGENISTTGLTEAHACIGDIYQLGSAVIQISQPRRPCWKIDARYEQQGITRFIEQTGCTGWYYRVLQPGTVAPEDRMQLLEQPHAGFSIQQLNTLNHEPRPDMGWLQRWAQLPALNADWRQRLQKRQQWLLANG